MNIALILSGGSGKRLGADIPKQYIIAGGRMLITECLGRVVSHPGIDRVQIVAHEGWRETILDDFMESYADGIIEDKISGFSRPGDTRQLSILNGMKDIAAYADPEDVLLIHDAARPLISSEQISACLKACEEHDGAMPVLPMKDTVYASNDGKTISELLDRKRIYAGQAPEAFRLGKYLGANEALLPDKILQINGSTEPAVMGGMDIAMIPGDENNFKITTAKDLERYESICASWSK